MSIQSQAMKQLIVWELATPVCEIKRYNNKKSVKT